METDIILFIDQVSAIFCEINKGLNLSMNLNCFLVWRDDSKLLYQVDQGSFLESQKKHLLMSTIDNIIQSCA